MIVSYFVRPITLLPNRVMASGQCINTKKMTIVFRRNVRESVKEKIMTLWDTKST